MIGKTFNSAIDTIKNTDWLQLGKDIIVGIGNGILAMATWLDETTHTIGQGILDTIKGVLGIHSPSVEFFQLGKFMMLGMANGISGNVNLVESSFKSIPNPSINSTINTKNNQDYSSIIKNQKSEKIDYKMMGYMTAQALIKAGIGG
jgi:hypothetical protein